jgi:tetratricopeptide (TPR) repeat protein
VNLLRKIFGGGAKRDSADEAPLLARELESVVAEAERLVAAGRHEEAMHVARSGLKKFPTATRLRSVVQYVRRAGANKRLLQLKKVLDEGKDERAYRELVGLHLDLRNKDQALEVAHEYLKAFPHETEAHIHLAEVHILRYFGEFFARDARAAIEHLERALEIRPETARAQLLLALLYYAIGAPVLCARHLGAAERLDPSIPGLQEFLQQIVAAGTGEAEEDVEYLLDHAEEHQEVPNDPSVFPGPRRFALESRGGALSPKLFASAAAGIGKRLRIEQLAAIGTGGRPLAVAGENKENFVRLACRLDAAARRAGRHMNFGTMQRFMVEGKFGRVVLVPAGNCAVAARAPRSVSTERIAEGLEMVVTASRAEDGQEDE